MFLYDDAIWQPRFVAFLRRTMDGDAAHGLDHVRRVVANATWLAAAEGADPAVTLPAAWLHDCVAVAKDDPDRAGASALAAAAATRFLKDAGYPVSLLPAVAHAIQAHSFSAGITPQTIEARVVQDADRLEALGAIGLVRCLQTGERLGRQLYEPNDPFCRQRVPDDDRFTIDHFYEKLLKLPALMRTPTGRRAAAKRARFLTLFLEQLQRELGAAADPTGSDSSA